MFSSFEDAVAEFDARLNERPADPGHFFSLEHIFRSILDTRSYIDRMNTILRSVFDRTTRTNALLTSGTFMSLHSSEQSTWIVMEHRRRSQFLYMTPVHALQSPIAGKGYKVDYFRLSDNAPSGAIRRDTRIVFDREAWIAPQSVARKAGDGEILDVQAHSEIRSFSLRVSSTPIGPFQINFDRETQNVFGLTPVNPMLSNLTTMFDLLADVASSSSIDFLRPFTQHDQHFVRWQAIRSIYAIDQGIGQLLVEGACQDPHEHVRAAAAGTLSLLSA